MTVEPRVTGTPERIFSESEIRREWLLAQLSWPRDLTFAETFPERRTSRPLSRFVALVVCVVSGALRWVGEWCVALVEDDARWRV